MHRKVLPCMSIVPAQSYWSHCQKTFLDTPCYFRLLCPTSYIPYSGNVIHHCQSTPLSAAPARELMDSTWGSLAMGLSPSDNRHPGGSRHSLFFTLWRPGLDLGEKWSLLAGFSMAVIYLSYFRGRCPRTLNSVLNFQRTDTSQGHKCGSLQWLAV